MAKVLKDLYHLTKLQFLTGITDMCSPGITSGGNHILNISLLKQYNSIAGFTKKEILKYFKKPLKEMAKSHLKN